VIAATNEPLRPLVAAGTVRADLYYRLNVICLDLPPLRARRADIPALIAHFLVRFAEAYRRWFASSPWPDFAPPQPMPRVPPPVDVAFRARLVEFLGRQKFIDLPGLAFSRT
jgi:hypothetical protein